MHSEILDAYPGILNVHSRTLDAHSRNLDAYPKILNVHPRILNAHPRILNAHPRTLDAHSTILNAQSRTLDTHSTILNAESGIFDAQSKIDQNELRIAAKQPKMVIQPPGNSLEIVLFESIATPFVESPSPPAVSCGGRRWRSRMRGALYEICAIYRRWSESARWRANDVLVKRPLIRLRHILPQLKSAGGEGLSIGGAAENERLR